MQELGLYNKVLLSKYGSKPEITEYSLILALVSTHNLKDAGERLGRGLTTVSGLVKEFNKVHNIKISNSSNWSLALLDIAGYKYCPYCNNLKARVEFSSNKSTYSGLKIWCKECDSKHYKENKELYNAYKAKYRASKLKATPKWADLEKIKEIYASCPEGYHVDHDIPLQGENVCGLHIETNLKHLPAKENLSKGNKFQEEW